ncbi:glycosyltransferase family 2 protein [Sphingomonas sp. CJ20]
MSTPTVSIILPAYNGAALIGATIDSVLAQSFADFELVVVDDCSTDDTWDVIARYADPRIRAFRASANGGPVLARNRAFAEARGTYIAGLDQDDLCAPDRLARQVAFLDAHPQVALVASDCNLLSEGKIRPWPGPGTLTPPVIDWLLMLQNPLVWSSVLFRADAARRLIPFERPQVRYAEDFDLYHRIRAHGEIARIDTPLLIYRCHPGGASKRFRDAMATSAAQVLAERYVPVFAGDAEAHAALVVRHLMARDPVPDLPTLARVLGTLDALHRHFGDSRALDADTRARIEREYVRLWWIVARPALRHRIARLRDLLPLRPPPVPLRAPDWLVSPLIGRARALARG